MHYLTKLHALLDKKNKRHLAWLVLFSIFVSFVETIGIAAIMPFIDVATNFDNIHSNQYYQWIFDFFGFRSDVNFAIIFGIALIGFFIFRLSINLLYSYIMSYFSQNIYTQITKKIFESYLKMPYKVFTNKNSSYLINYFKFNYLINKVNDKLLITNLKNKKTLVLRNNSFFKLLNYNFYLINNCSLIIPITNKKVYNNNNGMAMNYFEPII